jgi:hypothetical protein
VWNWYSPRVGLMASGKGEERWGWLVAWCGAGGGMACAAHNGTRLGLGLRSALYFLLPQFCFDLLKHLNMHSGKRHIWTLQNRKL